MQPYEYTVVELQYEAGNSNKFYRGYLDMQTGEVFYQFGKNTWQAQHGGNWTEKKQYDSVAKGYDKMMSQLKTKMAKGYEIVRTVRITCARQAEETDLANLICSSHEDDTNLILANV